MPVMTEAHFIVFLVSSAVVIIAVMLHYEALIMLSRGIATSHLSHRRRIVLSIFGLLLAHVAEIWLFGTCAWLLVEEWRMGQVVGLDDIDFLDYIYLSTVTYTTLGYGDIVPAGAVRFLLGVEALTGLVLITWSASFTFIEMQKYWKIDGGTEHGKAEHGRRRG